MTLGMDIGGTNTVVGLVNDNGNVLCTESVKTQQFPILEEYITAVCEKIHLLLHKENIDIADVKGLGIGAPNANYYTGNIEQAPNLPWKGTIPLARLFSDKLTVDAANPFRVLITNDANAAALGEKIYGTAKSFDHFIMITLGTGVGSGIVIDGKVVYGHDGFAGELGHVIIDRSATARQCGCGRRGCLEAYCSATGLIRTARERLQGVTIEGSKDVYDLAVGATGTPEQQQIANDIFCETGTLLGQAMADMVAFSSPEAFIIFGGLAKAGDLILKPTQKALEDNLLPIYKGKVKVLLSTMKDADAAVLGASALAV